VKSPKDDRWYYVVNTPILHADGSRSKQAMILDITDRKEAALAQEALIRSSQERQKLESLGMLAGGIAHDFNNMLMAILGRADLALAEPSAGDGLRHHLTKIVEVSRGASDLCQQLLAYGGKGKVTVEPINLSGLVHEMANMLDLAARPQTLTYGLDDGVPPVRADVAQIRQIIMNLVLNAAEAMAGRPGGVVVRTGTCRELPRSTFDFTEPGLAGGPYVTFEVADSGCGMDRQTRQSMFEPFFSTKAPSHGRGLGLSAVLGIVRAHNGALDVSSEVDVGTTVRVVFPASEDPKAVATAEVATARQWRGSGTVLAVDDDKIVLDVVAQMLAIIVFNVITADGGHDALDKFREHQGELSCIILDLSMPCMTGQQCLEQLRQIDPKVPVLLSSGHTEQEVPDALRALGQTAFIPKPYRLETLSGALERLLRATDEKTVS
jgi:signal transduction histidine kinase/CheY-like chemotaxis protein